jgi:hypothetical protein
MKIIIIIIALLTSIGVLGQSIVDPYEPHSNQTFPYLYYTSNDYNGEFMLKSYSNILKIGSNDIAVSYSIEAVSFPFIPSGFFTTGDADNSTVRNLVIPLQATYGTVHCGESNASGFGWNGVLYHKTSNMPFKNGNGEAWDITLASNSYYSTSGYSCNSLSMYIPHTVLKITINIHEGNSISSPILYSIPYYVDNTRGKLRNYPFISTNSTGASVESYDFLILPKIITKTDFQSQTYHYYNTNSNQTLYAGGTINYFLPLNSENTPTSTPLYPEYQEYSTRFFNIDPPNIYEYLYPAPFCIPNIEIRNARGSAFVGYDDSGVELPGIQHNYTINKSIDLTILNPEEKIIYNPSEASIDIQDGTHSLMFPTGYTFKTINGLFPTVSMVNNADPGNLYRDRQKVNVSNSAFPNNANQHTSVYHVKNGSTLIIEPCVSIIDATIKVEQGGVVKYDASRVYLINSSIIQSSPNNSGTIITNFNYNNQVFADCKQDCYDISNYNLYQNQYNSDIQIATSISWTSSNISNYFNTTSNIIKVPGKITIKSGNTLTIEQGLSFQFSEVGKIIVEKGAKLIVNGVQGNEVEFTSACNNMWEGIEVWGDETESQYANPISSTQQGYLELNYTKISDAITGILTGKKDYITTITDKTIAGGIIIARNSTFENNGTSIEFFPYQKYLNNIKLPNYSIIESCTLKTTALLKDQNLYPEIAGTQIKLNQVNFYSNNIKNCVFYTDKTKFEPANRGVAIEGHKATLRLFYANPSSFEGFTEAIVFENSNDGEKVYVDNCTFDDNIHSLVMDGISYLRLYRNTIDVPNSENFGYADADVDKHGYDNPVGIYMRFCPMNDMQENTITGNSPTSSLPFSYGIISNSTTGVASIGKVNLFQQKKDAQTNGGFGRIYNNTIANLSLAIQGELNNGGDDGVSINPSSFLPQNGVGEQFKCNSLNSNLKSDVFLIGKEVSTLGNPITYYGVFRTQGICTGTNGPAGNEFNSPDADYNLSIDPYNTSESYYYKGHNDFTPPTNNFDNGYVAQCSSINSSSSTCPSILTLLVSIYLV